MAQSLKDRTPPRKSVPVEHTLEARILAASAEVSRLKVVAVRGRPAALEMHRLMVARDELRALRLEQSREQTKDGPRSPSGQAQATSEARHKLRQAIPPEFYDWLGTQGRGARGALEAWQDAAQLREWQASEQGARFSERVVNEFHAEQATEDVARRQRVAAYERLREKGEG